MNKVTLNDKDIMMCTLTSLKEISKNLSIFLTESSNEEIYKRIKKLFDDCIALQRETFEIMNSSGMYDLTSLSETKINTEYEKLKKELENI